MIKDLVLVIAGSGIGGALRYLTGKCVGSHWCAGLPMGTLCANLAGCLLIGIFSGLYLRGSIDSSTKLLLTTGLCGGFTTFSTFCNENLQLLKGGQIELMIFYLIISLVLGIGLVWAGYTLTQLSK